MDAHANYLTTLALARRRMEGRITREQMLAALACVEDVRLAYPEPTYATPARRANPEADRERVAATLASIMRKRHPGTNWLPVDNAAVATGVVVTLGT